MRPRPLLSRLPLLLAFALFALAAPSARAIEIQVEVLQDSLAQPPVPASNVCTLRKAINNANDNLATYPQCQQGEPSNVAIDTIIFYVPGTITFALAGANEDGGETGDLDVTDSLTIIGHPDGTVIDAADLDRVFHIHPGATLTLVNIHITNGRGGGLGGAILIDGGTLNLQNSTVSNSLAFDGAGGGIYAMTNSVINMTNSTLTGNTSEDHAGGMFVEGGSVVQITNSTITNNNSNTGLCGGIANGGTVTLRSSIVAGNTNNSVINQIPNLNGVFNSAGYNVIGDLGSAPGDPVFNAQPTDQVGVTDAQVSLGPLASNGGPTPTHALLAGSVAIDKGHSSGATADQRGLPRPCDLAAVTNASGGDGGDAGAFELQGTCVVQGAPDAVNDTFAVAEDSGPNTLGVLANDTDPDNDTLTVTAVTQGASGAVAITGGGTGVSYSPNLNFFGADSFTYTVSDGNGNNDTATVSVTVTPVQDAPVAVGDAGTVAEDGPQITINVLANDFDVDGDGLVVVSVTQPPNGVAVNNGNSVSYTPNPDFNGTDSFSYTVSDGQGNTATAGVSVSVTPVNDAPAASDDAHGMTQDTTLDVAAPGVLANDADVDGDALSAALVSGPAHASGPGGSFIFNPDGSFSYKPDAGFVGTDSFTYRANDGTADSNVATVTITIADTQGPNLTSSVSVTSLWSPNHNLVNVGLTVNATDNSGDPVTTEVFVYSDEDDLTPDSPDHSPDAKDIAPGTLRLRAERDGGGDGRVYLIVVVATDSSNNKSRNCLTVVVPKSKSAADILAASQQAQAARDHCIATGMPPAGYFVVGDGAVVGPKQ